MFHDDNSLWVGGVDYNKFPSNRGFSTSYFVTRATRSPPETNMEKVDGQRSGSVASIHNAAVLAAANGEEKAPSSWLESKLRPTKINARYPIKGNPLLFATCGFGSLGDALFGYNSGVILSTREKRVPLLIPTTRHNVRLAC